VAEEDPPHALAGSWPLRVLHAAGGGAQYRKVDWSPATVFLSIILLKW